MYIIIIGAGNIGFSLAKKLQANRHQICLIDKDEERVKNLAQTSSLPVLRGDGTDIRLLKEAKIEETDALVALTSSDEVNIVASQLAKELFGVKRTIAKVNDPRHVKIFSRLGVDVPIDSTSILSRIVEEEASFSDFMNLLSIKKGKLSLVRVDLPERAPVLNKKVRELKLPSDTVLVSILRGSEVIIPKGDTQLTALDEIVALTNIEKEAELIKYLVGNL